MNDPFQNQIYRPPNTGQNNNQALQGNNNNIGVNLMLGIQPNHSISMVPQGVVRLEQRKKVFVGKIPRGLTDVFVEKLMRTCGNTTSFNRTKSASGEPAQFAFVEYQQVEGMLRALKILNGQQIRESCLLVKVDDNTQRFIAEWKQIKMREWFNNQKLLQKRRIKCAQESGQTLSQEELLRQFTPQDWQRATLGNLQLLRETLEELVNDKNYYEGNIQIYDPTIEFAKNIAQQAKYRQSEREKQRIRRIQQKKRDRERAERIMIRDYEQKEKQRLKEREKFDRKKKQLQKEKEDRINFDINYDSSNQKYDKKKYPDRYYGQKQERKKLRNRERQQDQQQRMIQLQIQKEKQHTRLEKMRLQEQEMRKKMEFQNRPKIEFVKYQQQEAQFSNKEQNHQNLKHQEQLSHDLSNDKRDDETQSALLQENQQYKDIQLSQLVVDLSKSSQQQGLNGQNDAYATNFYETAATKPNIFKKEDEEDQEDQEYFKLKTGGGQSGRVEAAIKQIEQNTATTSFIVKDQEEISLKRIKQDEQSKKKFQITKKVYMKMPRKKEDVYQYKLDYDLMVEVCKLYQASKQKKLFDRILLPWISKKMYQLLGLQQANLVQFFYKKVKDKKSPEQIENSASDFLEQKDSVSLVKSLLRYLIVRLGGFCLQNVSVFNI